jgi:hypothetical protein
VAGVGSAVAAALVTAEGVAAGRAARVGAPCAAGEEVRPGGVRFGAGLVAATLEGAPSLASAVASFAVASFAVASFAAPRPAAVPPPAVALGAPVLVPEREVDFLAGGRAGVVAPGAWSVSDSDAVTTGSTGAGSVFLVRGAREVTGFEPAGFDSGVGFAAAVDLGARGFDARAFAGALGFPATPALDGSAVVFSSGSESTR